eukprot:m.11467 g.11467  ORF g.11467 m.11467 type:complete len:465 (+) comp23382_c0_seq2:180-1574(+)
MNSSENTPATGLSTNEIIAASVAPSLFLLSLGALTCLIIWHRKRNSTTSDDKRVIVDEVDGGSSRGGGTLRSKISGHNRDSVTVDISQELNEGPSQLALPTRVNSADVKWLPTRDLYQSKRGRTGWQFPPLLGIEQEFPRDQLCTIKHLGDGAYAQLLQGEATMLLEDEPTSTTVIVKILKDSATNAQLHQFDEEVRTLAGLQHANLLELSAVCTTSHPMSMIFRIEDSVDVRSYLRTAAACHEPFGDTSFFSRQSANFSPITSSLFSDLLIANDLLAISHQVAQGMEYLSGEGFIHRDIATRNCYISDGVHIKIANFGISLDDHSDDYVQLPLTSGTTPRNVKLGAHPLPIRWMSPEAIQTGTFTTESDIWAFGILMWEVFTLGKRPYDVLTDKEVLQQVAKHGHTIDCPPGCPPEIHALMTKCWRQTPESRATFPEMRLTMQRWLKEGRFSEQEKTGSTTQL